MLDMGDLQTYFHTGKEALDLLKAAIPLLPNSKERESAQAKLATAEAIMTRNDAELAQKLNYHLCQCTFPPQIMLWKERQNAHVCPNPDCGRNADTSNCYAKVGPTWGNSRCG